MAGSGVLAGGRWLDAVESRPWGWLGAFVALAVLLVGGMLCWWAVFGFWDTLFDPNEPFGISFDGRNHVTLAVLLAFVASGTLWVRRGTLRDIQHLGEAAGVSSPELETALRRNTSSPPALHFAAFAAALGLGVAIIPLSSGLTLASLAGWDMHHVWAVASNVAMFFLMFDGAWLSVQGWRTIDEYVKRHVSIDLLDRQEMASIGRIGLRGAVLWLGGGTIASSLTWGMIRVAPVVVILAVLLAFATLSLLLPAQMARGSLREAKRAEIERVRAKIALARERVFSGSDAEASQQAAVLQGLLAYEARIDSVSEWPYDTSTLVRFGLLAVIATGSWLGGALVERAVSAVLD